MRRRDREVTDEKTGNLSRRQRRGVQVLRLSVEELSCKRKIE